MQNNTIDESLTVGADDQTLFLTSPGMQSFGKSRDQTLSQEGAAELFWSILIGPLQQRLS